MARVLGYPGVQPVVNQECLDAGAGRLWAAYDKDWIREAPRFRPSESLTALQELELCEHWGIQEGQGRAAELLFTGRSMTSDEGLAWGFFNRLVAPPDLLAEAVAFAATLANGPTLAHAMTKRMLHQEWNLSIEAAIEAEAQAQAVCMQTEDFRRAYRAFAAKSKPVFEGN